MRSQPKRNPRCSRTVQQMQPTTLTEQNYYTTPQESSNIVVRDATAHFEIPERLSLLKRKEELSSDRPLKKQRLEIKEENVCLPNNTTSSSSAQLNEQQSKIRKDQNDIDSNFNDNFQAMTLNSAFSNILKFVPTGLSD